MDELNQAVEMAAQSPAEALGGLLLFLLVMFGIYKFIKSRKDDDAGGTGGGGDRNGPPTTPK